MRIEDGLQTLRVVVDTIQQCNLRCLYCHPGEVWRTQHLEVDRLRPIFTAVERHGLLELVLSGGEITMHPQLPELLDATHLLERTAVVLITNATLVDDQLARAFAQANLARVCVSVDGVDNTAHGSARGKNHTRVIEGLRRIRATGRPVTVISVVHRGNIDRILELSAWLAETGLADQHHMCAPSYSGEAREHYPALRLELDDYLRLQRGIDAVHRQLAGQGLFVTFNSFWPATGRRSAVVDGGRRITLQQVVEQVKNTLVHIRPDGQLRLAAASWGRETVGSAVIGNAATGDPAELFALADRRYRDGSLGQLPREVEARHKFQLGDDADRQATNALIDSDASPDRVARLIPIRPLSHLSLLDDPLPLKVLRPLARAAQADPGNFRFVRHASGVGLVYDRRQSHVTLLHEREWPALARLLADQVAVAG